MTHRRGWWLSTLVLFAVVWGLIGYRPVSAHGGVVIQTGIHEHYEWMILIYPFPTPPGPGVITIFIYDYNVGGPSLEFSGEVYLAPPGAPGECCEPGVHQGPYPLYTDEVFYPGDYTAYLPFTEPGAWQVQFRMTSPDQEFEVIVPLDVQTVGNQTVDPTAIATQVAVLSAAALLPPAGTPAPLATPQVLTVGAVLGDPSRLESPLLSSSEPVSESVAVSEGSSRFQGWVWGGMAVVVVLGTIFSVWRVQQEDKE